MRQEWSETPTLPLGASVRQVARSGLWGVEGNAGLYQRLDVCCRPGAPKGRCSPPGAAKLTNQRKGPLACFLSNQIATSGSLAPCYVTSEKGLRVRSPLRQLLLCSGMPMNG